MAQLFGGLGIANEVIEEEFEDETKDQKLERKLNQLVHMITKSKNCTVYTGAGIQSVDKSAIPNKNYMAIKELVDKNIVKNIITQNNDGMHRRSGVGKSKVFELNGNKTLETCTKCS